jgi:hypothetical protein
MRRVSLLLIPGLALSVVAWSARAVAQETKTARGTVTAVMGDSVTVKVQNTDMKFSVDDKTTVIARGAGTATRQAQAAGRAGAKLTDVVKTGGSVEVTYQDVNGMHHATSIQAITSAAASSASGPAAKTASGTVKSVMASSLTVSGADGKDMTFSIDTKTGVVGRGVGTAASARGGKAPITDLVNVGDKVSVTYHDMSGTMLASSVRVTAKAPK